ncbi:hypothetical protein ACFLTD_04890, partial [Elusimicrobiota bacterium]
MKIIFCLSYVSVPRTLTVAEAASNEFRIVTSNKSAYKFFTKVYSKEKIIFLDKIPRFSKSPFKMLINLYRIFRYKSGIWKEFNVYKNCDVYFFGIACTELEDWLVLKLSKNNKILYKPAVSVKHLKVRYTFYSLMYVLMNMLTYGIRLE